MRLGATLAAATAVIHCASGSGGGANDPSGADNPLVGSPAPEIRAEAVMGDGPKTLKDANGKVVILDFWATHCGPCKKSFPKYQEIVNDYGGDVAVIAVATDDPEDVKKEQIEEFAKNTGVKFSIVWDKDKTAAKTYSPVTLPVSYIVDKGGVVRHFHVGYKDGEEAKIADEVKALVGK
jgi:thiol-disulfide isomerase/thioredoxin